MKQNKDKLFQLRINKDLQDEMDSLRENMDVNWSLDIRNFIKMRVAELKKQQLKDKESV